MSYIIACNAYIHYVRPVIAYLEDSTAIDVFDKTTIRWGWGRFKKYAYQYPTLDEALNDLKRLHEKGADSKIHFVENFKSGKRY